MAYLTTAEQGMLTSANAARSGVAAQSGSIGLGIMLGTASNILFGAIAGQKLKTMTGDIRAYSGQNIALAARISGKSLNAAMNDIMNTINEGFNDIIGLTCDGLLASVGGMYAALRDNFAASSTLLNSYNGLIQRVGIDPYINRWVNDTIRPNIPDAETAWFMAKVGAIPDEAYRKCLAQNGWAESFKDPLEWAWVRQPNLNVLLDIRRRGIIDDATLKSLLNWHRFTAPVQDMIVKLAVQKPEPYRAADFAAKELITLPEQAESFKWYGLSEQDAFAWRESQYKYPDLNAMMELLWREHITTDMFHNWLVRQGYPHWVREQLIKLKDSLPPSGDLVTMVVREAFDPKYVVTAPGVFATEMAKKGFDKTWSDRYWTAHFLPMPINQAYDNLRRGYWTKEQFLELLRIADIHPTWREDIYNVAYNPPSIREMGYGWDVGVYTEEDIVRFRRWGGLNAEDAAKAGRSMVAYRTEAERNAVRTELMYSYGRGELTDDSFQISLAQIHTPKEAIPLWLKRAQLYKKRIQKPSMDVEGLIISSSEAITAFKLGFRDETWLRGKLKELDWADDRIQLAVERAKYDIAPKPPVEPVVTYQLLTAAQMKDLYFQGLIDETFMLNVFTERGYTREDALLLVQLYTYVQETPTPQPIEERVFTGSEAISAFKLGLRDEAWLRKTLKELNWADERIQLAVERAKLQPEVVTKYQLLTAAQMGDMYSKGLINEALMLNVFIEKGYSPEDAQLLVQVYTFIQEKPMPVKSFTTGVAADMYYLEMFDEEDLYSNFRAQDYDEAQAWLLVLYTRLEQIVPMFKTIYAEGAIDDIDLRNYLISYGLEPDQATSLTHKIMEEVQVKRLSTEKDLTKAEIIKGVKNNVFSSGQGIELLVDLNYSEEEAGYILALNKVTTAGDPESFLEMKRVTEAYKQARGEKPMVIPDEAIAIELQMKTVKAELDKERKIGVNEEKIAELALKLNDLEGRLRTVLAKSRTI